MTTLGFPGKNERSPFPYKAVKINFDDIKDFTKNQRYPSIRPGKMKNDPIVTDLKTLQYNLDGVIHYKLDFDDDRKELPHRAKSIDELYV